MTYTYKFNSLNNLFFGKHVKGFFADNCDFFTDFDRIFD